MGGCNHNFNSARLLNPQDFQEEEEKNPIINKANIF